MRVINFSPAAVDDINMIWDYSADRWGVCQADRYVDEIRDACHALANKIKQGRPAAIKGFHKYLCGSHIIYFLDKSKSIDVIRILHQRQDAERHL